MARWTAAAGGIALLLASLGGAGRARAGNVGERGGRGEGRAGGERGEADTPWYFAVSGDSRDCGDLIMPKIAAAITAAQATAPVAFYWHLGDFRRLTEVDCDIAKRAQPGYDCASRPAGGLGGGGMSEYLDQAWPDFVEQQIRPFGATPVFLGIGNHELTAGRDRDDVRRFFRRWLTQEPIQRQRAADARRFGSTEGDTYYHFVWRGVDFITLDNADAASFSAPQLAWLARVLAEDAGDPAITTIVAGMHEALPYSRSRGHAMDASCQGLCSGGQAYDLLYRAQGAAGTPARRKHVYVFASHAHLFQEDIFNQPEHAGQILPGWLIGTAGAEQYGESIRYGYLEVAVRPDGTLAPRFREVTRDMAPASPAGSSLAEFCFSRNKRTPADSAFHGPCACGAAVP